MDLDKLLGEMINKNMTLFWGHSNVEMSAPVWMFERLRFSVQQKLKWRCSKNATMGRRCEF